MQRSSLGVVLVCVAALVTASLVAVAQRPAPGHIPDTIEVVADWETSDAFMDRMINRNTPKSAELIAQEMANHEIGRDLKQGRVSVLVHTDQGLARGANVRQSVRAFAAQNQGVVKHEYGSAYPGVMNLRGIPEGMIQALGRIPGVTKVEIDQYHADVVTLHDSIPLIRGLSSQISGAGYSADGAGVRICIVDTGIDTDHLMFADRIDSAAGYDFYNNDSNPEDDNGHGSHCAGIALGGLGLSWDPCGTGSVPIQGVAPAATLIGAKVLNSGGGGFDSDIIAGIDHCADQSASGGRADIISMSIGTGNFSGPCTHSWAVAANNAAANGVVAIAASGNENNSNSMGSPACGADVIAVGMTWKADYPTCEDATTNWSWGICTDFGPQTDDVGCFSNESDYLDVTAPGANIWSASISSPSSITGSSGTSMSCPTVAGLAALVLDIDPSLTPAQVRQIIRDGAIDLGPAGFDRGYGWGRIDVLNTLALVQPPVCPDGQCTGTEDQCSCPQDCGSPPSSEAGLCNDGEDNDCDGQTDCDDSDCASDYNCICDDDGTCETGEDCINCPNDCFAGSGASCGNGVCETADGENCQNCSADCNGTTGGRPSSRYCCGDGTGQYGVTCADGRCTGSGNTCSSVPTIGSCCGDGTCEGSEDDVNCTVDCGCLGDGDCDDGDGCNGSETCVGGSCQAGTPIVCDDGDACTSDSCSGGICFNDPIVPCCGDTFCDNGEDECSCPSDCGNPPGTETNCADGIDDDCDGQTDCNDSDCSGDSNCVGQAVCGNNICEAWGGEDCLSCASDCNGVQNGKPANRYCCGDGDGQNPVSCSDNRCTGSGNTCEP